MAKGVTEIEVHTTADALVAAGERPTVERIRASLGRGSPNTVGRFLDSWWGTLAARLTAQQCKLTLPEAPPEVAALAGQLWEQALHAAHTQATVAFQQEREGLAADRLVLAREREALLEDAQTQRAILFGAREASALANARLEASQRLVDQQAAQLTDLTGQRDALQTRLAQGEREQAALTARLQQQDAAMVAERDTQAQHLRATEDRAHAEIDRARQEARELRAQRVTERREQVALERQLRRERDQATEKAVAAARDHAAERARADALAWQLQQFRDLPAARQAALSRAAGAKPKSKPKARAKA